MMENLDAINQGIESIELEAVIIRANGSTEIVGQVAGYYRDSDRQQTAKDAGLGEITICE